MVHKKLSTGSSGLLSKAGAAAPATEKNVCHRHNPNQRDRQDTTAKPGYQEPPPRTPPRRPLRTERYRVEAKPSQDSPRTTTLTSLEEGRHDRHRGRHPRREAACPPRRPLQPGHLGLQRRDRGVGRAGVREPSVLCSRLVFDGHGKEVQSGGRVTKHVVCTTATVSEM